MNRKQRRAEKLPGKPANHVPAIPGMFAAALQYHQAGRVKEAERLYRQCLTINPRHADSLHLLGLVAHAVFRETERWKLVLLATVPGLLLPHVSADYTLIGLYFPLVFFLNARRVSRLDVVYVALFGILLVPVDYYYFLYYIPRDNTILHDISISVVIYPAALVALVLLAMLDVQRDAGHVEGERRKNRWSLKRGRWGRGIRSPVDADEPGLIGRPPVTEHRRFRWRGRVRPPSAGTREQMLRGRG